MVAYYSREALSLDQWAREEPNRIKAAHIYKAAQSLERRYRANHNYEVNDPSRRPCVNPGKPPSVGSSITRCQ